MPKSVKRQGRKNPAFEPGIMPELMGAGLLAAIAQHVKACPHCREKLVATLGECPQACWELLVIREKKVQLEQIHGGIENLFDSIERLFS